MPRAARPGVLITFPATVLPVDRPTRDSRRTGSIMSLRPTNGKTVATPSPFISEPVHNKGSPITRSTPTRTQAVHQRLKRLDLKMGRPSGAEVLF